MCVGGGGVSWYDSIEGMDKDNYPYNDRVCEKVTVAKLPHTPSPLKDIDFFQHLEMHMRAELPSLVGRDHLSFRSYYVPAKVC